jgi:hypothetical protein
VRGIGGETRRALKFLVGRSERGFDLLPARAIFFRIDRQLCDRGGKPPRDEMAGDEPEEQERSAGAEDLPAETMLPRDRAL